MCRLKQVLWAASTYDFAVLNCTEGGTLKKDQLLVGQNLKVCTVLEST